jgi:hypothetical protein
MQHATGELENTAGLDPQSATSRGAHRGAAACPRGVRRDVTTEHG